MNANAARILRKTLTKMLCKSPSRPASLRRSRSSTSRFSRLTTGSRRSATRRTATQATTPAAQTRHQQATKSNFISRLVVRKALEKSRAFLLQKPARSKGLVFLLQNPAHEVRTWSLRRVPASAKQALTSCGLLQNQAITLCELVQN